MKKVLKTACWAVAASCVAAVILLGAAIVVNRHDRPPTQTALDMHAQVENRPAVPDIDNGYVYAWGLPTPLEVDAQQAGAALAGWVDAINGDPTQYDAVPVFGSAGFNLSDYPQQEQLADMCRVGDGKSCRDRFEELAAQPAPAGTEAGYLERYHELLRRSAWREVVSFDFKVPVPAYTSTLHLQRLMLQDLRRHARPGAAAEIRAILQADHGFWRRAQKSSDQLLSKMVAVTALRQNFYFGNLVIRALPPQEQSAAVPEGWSQEFSRVEIDMHRMMAGELWMAENAVRSAFDTVYMDALHGVRYEHHGWLTHRLTDLATRLYQPQEQVNRLAEEFRAVADTFDVPLAGYAEARKALREHRDSAGSFSWTLYNPVGQWMMSSRGHDGYDDVPLKVASIEAMRRAALLTVQLRSRGVAPADMAGQVASSELRNPFDGKAFEWSAPDQAVVFSEPGRPEGQRHLYFY